MPTTPSASPHWTADVLTCADLGCVNGLTVQGRSYDCDGNGEDQWAPCGRRAETCPPPEAAGAPDA